MIVLTTTATAGSLREWKTRKATATATAKATASACTAL
jgi:hypothetical protein